MEQKINIAEILKDCPKGTKLYSPLCGECVFQYIHSELKKIIISTSDGTTLSFHNNGKYHQMDNSECLLFPSKENRDWSKFQRPFKDGDILATDLGSVFYLNTRLNTDEYYGCYVGKGGDGSFHICEPFAYKECCGLATEEEKQKLFDAIKAKGCKWNPETKSLEKLIEPQFKVGDRINKKDSIEDIGLITDITDDYYVVETKYGMEIAISINIQNNYELVPNKFDITTLVPFESRVLVRDNNLQKWFPAIWGYYDFDSHGYPYKLIGGVAARYCIPYEDNQHLLGTTDDCDEFYKTWV